MNSIIASSQTYRPSLREELDKFGTLPDEAIYLGTAADGLPVLLDYDSKKKHQILFECAYPLHIPVMSSQKYINFATISKSELYGEAGAQKILALHVWARRKNVVVLVEDFNLILEQDFECRQDFLSLMGRVHILAVALKPVEKAWRDRFWFRVHKEGEWFVADKDVPPFYTPMEVG